MVYTTAVHASDLFKHVMLDAALPPIDQSLCCCSLLDPQLAPEQHLDDCVLHLLDPTLLQPMPNDFNDASSATSSPREDRGTERRRKHRESMARLRQCWRASIATLQRQERQLQCELGHSLLVASTKEEHPVHPLEVLHKSYCELVQEQLRLEQERASLEAAKAHNEKYERLLERELDRVRLFHAVSNDRTAAPKQCPRETGTSQEHHVVARSAAVIVTGFECL